ncbi:hypothetical protein Godav_017136 [Gossypium davidsonii]|uniref:Uncharacterized protein n=1 Tax=Gossypium davidsonii TaxID=34287 RepID=A0A7J8QSE5_GOSDV|nr:hypothetical protein [Gossypium davidsonii]
MAGREVREYTNLSDPKGKYENRNLNRRDLGFSHWAFDTSRCKRLLENVEATYMGEAVALLYLDDLLYLKEQMEAEEDAERLLRRTEKRAFAAFKISYFEHFLQQDLLKKVVEVKPKRPKISSPSSSEPEVNQSNLQSQGQESNHEKKIGHCVSESNTAEKQNKVEKSTKSLLGLAYASSDDDDDDDDDD